MYLHCILKNFICPSQCNDDANAGTGAGRGRGGRDRRRGRGALGTRVVSRSGSSEGAPMHAADVASRDGRGGASELGPQAAGTARAGVGTGDSAGAAVRQRGLGSGRVRESEKGREGPYVRHDLAPITTAPSLAPITTMPRSTTPRSTAPSPRPRRQNLWRRDL